MSGTDGGRPNAWSVYRRDLGRLARVSKAWIIIIGVIVTPSLYPPRDGSTGLPDLSPTETYLGRFGIFAIVGFLQVLPQWFQSISPFLPATHAVNAMRSAIAGIYQNDYWVSLGWLAAFAVPALLLGLVLRRPFIRSNQKMLAALESTKLM